MYCIHISNLSFVELSLAGELIRIHGANIPAVYDIPEKNDVEISTNSNLLFIN